MTNDQKQKIQQMRIEGQSYLQIATALCISENTVKSYCRRNNLTTVKVSRPAVKEIQSICKQCSKLLTQGKKGQYKKFCSDECRRAWWKANEGQLVKKAWYTLTCAECGRVFESYGNRKRRFCGHACYIANRFGKAGDEHDSRAI